jgi:protein subunit release factor B
MNEQDPALLKRMAALGIREEDLLESFIRGSGPGGQKINKTASTVQLRHPPSDIEIRCQRGRSQSANRYWARMELCDQLEQRKAQKMLEAQQAREKIRRQSRPRPKALQEKILSGKHQRAEVKKSRGKIRVDPD